MKRKEKKRKEKKRKEKKRKEKKRKENLFNDVQGQTGGGVSFVLHLPQQPLATHEPPGLPHEGC